MTMVRVVLVVGLMACGRIGFDALPAANLDAAAPPPPWSENFTMEVPQPVDELNTADSEVESYLQPNGRDFYFARTGATRQEIFRASRASMADTFANVTLESGLMTTADEARLVTVDGLHAYFWSGRATVDADIWHVSRASTTEPFLSANATPVVGLDTPSNEYDPWLSHDGKRIYFASDSAVQYDIYVVELVTPTQAGSAQLVTGIDSPAEDSNPTLSADELFIVFSSMRGGGAYELYYARRSSSTESFGVPQLLPVVNTSASDSEPCIDDGGELFFSSDRPGGQGNMDIYRSRFIPQ
jgi:hypothetical protein